MKNFNEITPLRFNTLLSTNFTEPAENEDHKPDVTFLD